MDPLKDAKTSSKTSSLPEAAQAEIDRRLFHLKTLYDVIRELLGVVEIKRYLEELFADDTGEFRCGRRLYSDTWLTVHRN